MLNLFALVKDPAARVQRFTLAKEVQTEITDYLQKQEIAFDKAEAEIAFDGKYKPDQGEVLYIDDFDDINKLGAAVAEPMSVPELVPSIEIFDSITALFAGRVEKDKTTTVLLQNFDRRRVLSTRGFTIFQSGDHFKRIDGLGLTVDNRLAAVLSGKRLRFSSFHNARQIFDLTAHYVEATDADIAAFTEMPNIHADKAALVASADTWIRRKFALVQQSQILSKYPLAQIQKAAADFGVAIAVEAISGVDKIVLPQDKAELKTLLRFLDEDIYEAVFTKTRYVTNSKREAKISKKP